MSAGQVETRSRRAAAQKTRWETYADNKQAFTDVFGDPFAKPEAIPGQYQTYKGRGLIAAMRNNLDEGKGTRNLAAPSVMDFFCDVENILTRNLSPQEQAKFTETYFYEVDGVLTTKERNEIEQKLGSLFRARKISPVSRYFRTIRQPIRGR